MDQLIVLLTKLIVDIKARELWDALGDVGALIALAAPFIKAFLSGPAAHEPHMMFAEAPCNSLDDYAVHLEAHLEDAKAGAIDWTKLGALLAQLAPFLIALFLKKKPA